MFASNFRVRTHSIFLTVAMLAALLFAPPSAVAADPVPGADFTLTILHNNDGESQLINAGSGLEDFGGIARFKTLVDGLRADAIANGNGVLMLSSGDNFLAGPEFNASIENGIPYYDALGIEAIGYDAISLGNHDFDFGPDTLANFLSSYSSAPQYLNANLDFSGEPGLQAFVDSGVIAPSTVISTGGEDIGIIGAITPGLRSISSPRGVVIDFDVAGAIQAEIDTLTASGVNKIVIISHLQSIDEDIALAAQLTGVDVMIAGGGDELLANPGDPLVPGEEDDVFGAYPLTATGGDGASIPIVTTPGEYKYLGQLSVGFDADGNVIGVGADSGPKVVDGTLTPDAAVQAAVVDPVVAALATLDSTVIGTSEVTLDGTRATVRSVESNEGNLIADALRWQATELAADFGVNAPDVALQNGGGIRNNVTIPAGDITLLDTFDSVPFSNFVSIVPDIQRWKFRNILENAVSNVPGDGRFAQISGFSFTYDTNGIPMNIDDETGAITQLGNRILDVTLDDGTEIVKDGVVIPGDRITIATIDFLARGGDEYPYVGAPFTSVGVSYQQAMANYIIDGLNGLITAADYPEGGEGRITAIAGMVDGPFTPIYDVQGDGDASPLEGEIVEIEGTVTGVFPDLGGFYLQETVGDGDAATSDGVFVESDEAVATGTHAAVLGVVEENFGETRVAASAVDTVANGAALAPTEVTLPLAEGASLEAYEGMLVTFPDYLYVSDMFNLHRFGETLLSAGGVLVNPTDIAAPGDEANAVAAANTARSIVLDDGSGAQFPDEVPYTDNGMRRRGDAAQNITANLSFSFGAYKLQPTEEVTFVEMNPRPAAPDDVGGNVKVASFNVLNFFSTIDDGVNDARGADSAAEKAAQLTKLVAAINGLDADIIGLQEIENNGPVAIGELVDALNADNGEGTWAAAADPDYPGGLEATNAIKVAIIFKPASVTPVGVTEVSEDPVFAADRPAIAHSFEAFGDTFTVINNHFKSKSSSNAEGADLDQGDGQGAYNARRTAQAGALLDFTLERIGATGDGDVIVIGDFNSYQNEDPIATLEGAGFLANLVKDRLAAEDSYSLVFFGQQGLLDGAFATVTLDPKVTGIDIWHINADEPRVLQYNDDVVDAGESSSAFNQPLSQPDAYSSSDHDPIVVGLRLGAATAVASGLYNPRHLSMGADGTVYVAESGVGGDEPCLTGGDGSTECFGLTGAVTAITAAGQERIASGLPSVAADGFASTGPSDVAVASDGTVRALIGLGQDPAVRDEILTPAGGGAMGQIVNIGADGSATPILDVSAYEAAANPDGGFIDSNPNALIHTDEGYLIADAGANALLRFDGTSLSTVAVFPERLVQAPPFIPDPEIPMQSVPTSVTVGPDSAYYVGELTGFPFPVGGANVYRVDPATGDVSVFADGFTNIVDLEFGPNGDLYVVQISSSSLLSDELDGAVIKVTPDGSREVFFDDLYAPSGIAIDQANGDVYVSNCGICPGFGEVLLISGDFVASPISLAYSASNDRRAPIALDGATVSGKIYPFVEPLDPGLGFTTLDFYLDGEPARTEYLAPYDFAGGLLTMATAFDTSQVADGAHTIKASGNLPDGSTVETMATFTVDNAPTMTEDFTVAFSDSEFRTDPLMLEGASVRGKVYPFVYPLFPDGFESYGRVSFYLDGEAFHTEYQAPYDFVSGGIAKANEVWNTTSLEDGVHTITVKAHRDGATPLMTTVTFTVSNDTEPPPPPPPPPPEAVRFATFNASLNRFNAGDLVADLSTPDNPQAKVIAEIIQRTRPEVLLLNEFDYDVDGEAARLFQENYLAVPQNGAEPIVYGYAFSAPSNTGVASGLDLDNSGDVGGPGDAFGFGFFEGQFGMQVYSQYPIDFANVRTFQNFRWADMPGALLPVDPATGEGWYSEEELASFRLSSKSHWDVPIVVGEGVVNFLVSHPTPPVFDGPEDRNGTRNSDEIRFWADYVNGATYIYDDDGGTGGWSGDYFVIAGDQNSDPNDGDSLPDAITQLLDVPRVNTTMTPSSLGAVEQDGLQGGANLAHLSDPAYDTADFNDNPAPGNLRADYVLPSNNLAIVDSGVFWPESTDPFFPLVGTFPFPSSDHRLVWVDLLPGDEPLADPSIGEVPEPRDPDSIPLPNGFQPEGVAIGSGNDVFAGSLSTGVIYKADISTKEGAPLVIPTDGRSAVGMTVDERTNYLYVAGGPFGNAFVYDGDTGAEAAAIQLNAEAPFETLVNDVVVTDDAAYFTDSFRPVFYRVALGADGALPDPIIVEEIALGTDFPFIPGGINSNGVVAAGDSLLINHTDEGRLFKVDPVAGGASEVDLDGATLPSGDGLVLDGTTLYVVQNNLNQIGVVELSADFTTGSLVGTITSPLFRVPTTADQSNGDLYVVNARFDVAPPPFPGFPPADPGLDYDIVRVSKSDVVPLPDVVELQILAINDFHGNIATTSSAFGGVGRADFLAANMAAAEAEAANSIIVSAGDLIGASPLVSALFHDEPTIEAMNLIGLDINGVGNHEFDEGADELLRMANGGSHPVDGDLDGDGFAGADFEFLAANVVDDASGETIFAPYTVKEYEGVKVAFIGMTLEGTPSIVTPSGVAGLTFNDEVDTVNALIPEIQGQGIEAIVVLMHEGGVASEGGGDGDGCGTLSGALYDIVVGLDDAVDLVIGGHNNQRFVCTDVAGKAVTMAYHSGRMFTDIDTVLDKTTGEMTIVAIDNKENFQEGVTPEADVTALIDKYEALAAPLADTVIGSISADILRTNNDAGESALGDVIADAQLAATSSAATGGAVIAFMNPGGIRGDMLFADVGGPSPGEVSFGEAFRIQPFGNSLVTMTLTGAQIRDLLTQQWSDPDDPSILQVSNGFTYSWDANAAVAARVDASSMMLNGAMIDPGSDYRVTVNSFLADGGDGFSVLTEGTDRLGGEVDLDALVTYFGANSPIGPGPQDRITRVEGTPPAPVDVLLTATLNGLNEVPGPGDPDGSGRAELTIVGTTLSWDISVRSIGDIQGGHIHTGDDTEAGPVFINLDLGPVVFVDDGTGMFTATGSLTITEEQAQAVAADPDGYYVNLHTPQFPAGAIRGQLEEPN